MVPETLLHYRILQPLGSGGMGDVYLAEDTKLGRRVALKVLPRSRADDPEHRQRFEREARAVAALNHPNIVTIHSVEHADEITFLTMELVEGKTLSQLIQQGGLPVDRLLKLAIPLADAVATAHDRGITHRDLKPGNVMVGSDGRVKVLDFGLAKLQEVAATPEAQMTSLKPDVLTGEGKIVGTVAYMSPEQAEGKAVDHRSDIFSLGVVLYELATGNRPFKGDTNVSVMSSILRDTPTSITEINQSLPRDLARIVKRALVKDPEHRYQTAKDLRNDLETLKEEIESGEVQSSAAVAPAARPVEAATSRAGMLVASAGVLVLAVVGGGLWWYSRGQTATPAAPTERPFENLRPTQLTSTGNVSTAAISADGRYVVHVVVDAGKQSLWLRQVATTSNVQIVAPDAVRYDGISFSPDGNFVYYVVYEGAGNVSKVYQVPVLGGAARKIVEDVDTPLTSSPDGKQIAFVRGYQSKGETVVIVAAADGTGERRVAATQYPLAFNLNNLSWSPDGSTLATMQQADLQGRQKIVAVNVSTGAVTVVGQLWSSVDSIAWTPDGKGLIAAAAEDAPGAPTQLWYVTYPAGGARRVTNDLNNYTQVTVSADGRTVSAVQRETRSHIWVAPTGDASRARQITAGTGRTTGGGGISWTPDGRVVYATNASGNQDIWIADASGERQTQLTVDPARDFAPAVTPDGRTVIFQSNRAGASIWQMDIDGGNQRPLVTAADAFSPIVSADSKWLYYTTFAVPRQLWRMPLTGGSAERVTAQWDELGIKVEGAFYSPTAIVLDLSPDTTQALAFYIDPQQRGGRLGVFPIAGGQPKRFEILGGARFTPDGKSILYLDPTGAVANLAQQPIAGGAPTRVTSFTSDGVFNFAISRDGKQLALSRGSVTSDVVLMRQP